MKRHLPPLGTPLFKGISRDLVEVEVKSNKIFQRHQWKCAEERRRGTRNLCAHYATIIYQSWNSKNICKI